MNLLSVQLQSLQRKIILRFDHALYMATHFSQNMVPLLSRCTGQNICLLRGAEAWILLGNDSRFVCGTMKTMGYKPTRAVFSSDQSPEGVSNNRSFWIFYDRRPKEMCITDRDRFQNCNISFQTLQQHFTLLPVSWAYYLCTFQITLILFCSSQSCLLPT